MPGSGDDYIKSGLAGLFVGGLATAGAAVGGVLRDQITGNANVKQSALIVGLGNFAFTVGYNLFSKKPQEVRANANKKTNQTKNDGGNKENSCSFLKFAGGLAIAEFMGTALSYPFFEFLTDAEAPEMAFVDLGLGFPIKATTFYCALHLINQFYSNQVNRSVTPSLGYP